MSHDKQWRGGRPAQSLEGTLTSQLESEVQKMIEELRRRTRDESGFTLVELLVVMLILAMIAAIAVPAFYNQRIKAQDAEAKTIAHTAQTAMETAATESSGRYTGVDRARLKSIEPTLSSATTGTNTISLLTVASNAYTLTVTSGSGNTFSIQRATSGQLSFPCGTGGTGGCKTGSVWD